MAFMKPVSDRTADYQYRELLRLVLEQGVLDHTQQGTDTISLMAPDPLRFKLSNGFPMITERNLNPPTSEKLPVTIWQQAIGEIFAFINGARTTEQLEAFGCHWWKMWATPEKCAKRGLEPGDLGPGSYGAAFHDFPTIESGSFNQFAQILEQIEELPHLKTHLVTPFIPQYMIRGKGKQQKVVVVPCHGLVHLRVLNNKLTLHMFQRSSDLVVGLPSNLVQYAALLMAIAQVTGFEADELILSISDAHIFVDHLPAVEKMLNRTPYTFPTMTVDENVGNLFAFRREHFVLSDYQSHPGMKGLPVAI
jgi:thymidylate synthase